MQKEIDNKQLRSFGLIVGGIFAVIGVWPLVIHRAEPRWWALIVAATFGAARGDLSSDFILAS